MHPPTDSADASQLLERDARLLHEYFEDVLGRYPNAPARLMEAIRYSLLAGGKRLRPALVIRCAEACGGVVGNALLAPAAAMELIHTFSLVHDDLPAMDDDDLRRGRPTNHKVFGEAMAILAGDAMTTMAFELIATDAPPTLVAPLVRELASASGPDGMIGGQVLDIDSESRSLQLPELQKLHRMKTGALLRCSCRMGAIAGGGSAQKIEALSEFGRHLGLAFQIVDDLLDVTSTPEQMGKATGKDAGRGKNTYPNIMGVEPSRKAAADELAAAMQTLTPFDDTAKVLKILAQFVVDRAV